MFSEGDASSSGPVHCLAVQQVTCCGLLSYRIQAGGGPSTCMYKSGLDASNLKNYRPVSNLSFLSKLLEKVLQDRLLAFLDVDDLMPCA